MIIIILVCCAKQGYSQNFDEWFNQKKTQTKYLIEQIAALQAYLGEVQQGYTTLHKGLSLIGDIKNGEFSLHQNYFNDLNAVNPSIMKYPKVAGILSLQLGMLRQYHDALRVVRESGEFNASEIAYIKKVYDNLTTEAEKDLDELTTVTTTGDMQMTDDKRLMVIDRRYADMRDKYAFLENFNTRVSQLAAQRKRGQSYAEALKKLYDQP